MKPPPDLDDLDLRILDHVQRDNSLTNQDLARAVHASAPTCLRRVKRLVDEGYIEREVALLNPAKLNLGLTAIIEVTLDVQTAEHLDEFEAAITDEEAIL